MMPITEKEIDAIRAACWNEIYGEGCDNEGADIRALALLPNILGVFPKKLFTTCPELEAAYQKLIKGEVKL